MSAIRVSCFNTEHVSEKQLHAHFANPSNGGGKISAIYYPVFDGDAVIIFEDEHIADFVQNHQQIINDEDVLIKALPRLQVYKKLRAEVDSAVTAFLQTTESARDEIVHHAGIDYYYDTQSDTAYLTGTWYQLEWAWKFLDDVMRQQQKAQKSIANQMEIQDLERSIRQKARENRIQASSSRRGDSWEENIDNRNIQLPKSTNRISGDDAVIISMPGQEGDKTVTTHNMHDDKHEATATAQCLADNKTQSERRRRPEQEGSVKDSRSNKGVDRVLSVEEEDFRNLQRVHFRHEGMEISIYAGDIALANTEAIVNSGMHDRTTISRAFPAEGSLMYAELQKYFASHDKLETGDVVCTSAGGEFGPNIKYILHTVGPLWNEDLTQDVGEYQLTTTFLNCLNRANELKLSSIVFPAISTGTFRGSLEVCMKCFLDAVLLYAYEQKNKQFLKEVHLVNNDEDRAANMILTIRPLLKKGLDLLTLEAIEQNEKMKIKKKKNPGLFAKMKAGISELLCGSKQGAAASKLQGSKAPMAKQSGIVNKTSTAGRATAGRPLPPFRQGSFITRKM